MKTIQELIAERERIGNEQRAMLDRAISEHRDLRSDEQTRYDEMDVDYARLTSEINKLRAGSELRNQPIRPEPQAAYYRSSPSREGIGIYLPGEFGRTFRTIAPTEQERSDRVAYLTRGLHMLTDAQKERYEQRRTLQMDKDTVGGFLVMDSAFATEVIRDLHDLVWLMTQSRILTVPNAQSITWPVLDDTISDSDWTSELKTGSEDSSMNFERLQLSPKPLAKRIKASSTLIRRSKDADKIIRSELAYKFGVTCEKAFLTGSGANQPLGVFTASAAGISTARDVSTGNTSTEIKADNLIECKYTLKAQWRKNAKWLFHRDALKMIRKLKDGSGDYIWKAGLSSDRPDTILDYPVMESEYVPSTFTSGMYVGILGDFSWYGIAISLDMTVAVLTELYAETNEIGYIGRMELDGNALREKAFVRVKLG